METITLYTIRFCLCIAFILFLLLFIAFHPHPEYIVESGTTVTYDADTGIYTIKETVEKGINFEYNYLTGGLETFEPDPNTLYHEKEMHWTCWPDGVRKVLITYKLSQSLKDKIKQYSDEQYTVSYNHDRITH